MKVIDILKRQCINNVTKLSFDFCDYYLKQGDKGAVELGVFINSVANELDKTIPQTRHTLNKLVEKGLVTKQSNPGGRTRYWPNGLAQKLVKQ